MPDANDNLDRGDVLPGSAPADDVTKTDDTPGTDPKGTEGEGEPKGDSLDGGAKGDDEGAETPEEKAERERLEAEAEAKRRIRIPKARFDEAQAKARQREQALLEEIEKLKGGQQASVTQQAVSEAKAKINELQDKYEDLILDGKKEEARKVRIQLDGMREELSEYQTSVKADAARRAAIDDLSYNAQLASYESKYPALNPDHDSFDAAKTDEVAALMTAFVKSGDNRAAALARAVKYALGDAPAPAANDEAQRLAAQRAEAARKKAAEANSKQPASLSKVGLDSDKAGGAPGAAVGIDVMRLSQEKFAKLDEETKAKLRGDEVT
jgi:hypothetical protein